MIVETGVFLMVVTAIFWLFRVSKPKSRLVLVPHPSNSQFGRLRHNAAMFDLLPDAAQCIVVNSFELPGATLLTQMNAFLRKPLPSVKRHMTRLGDDVICTNSMLYQREFTQSAALRMYRNEIERVESTFCDDVEELCSRLRAHKGRLVDEMSLYSNFIDEPEVLNFVHYNAGTMARLPGNYELIDRFSWPRFPPTENDDILRESMVPQNSILNANYHKEKEKFHEDIIKNNFKMSDLTDEILYGK